MVDTASELSSKSCPTLHMIGHVYQRVPAAEDRADFARLQAHLFLQGLAAYLDERSPTSTQSPPATPIAHAPPSIRGSISRVLLTNLRSLPSLDWVLPSTRAGWHVLLGQNAAGKTSVLRAIAAALLPADELGALRQDWARWVLRGADDASASIEVTNDSESQRVEWRITDGGLTKLGHEFGGFSAAYGPFRRFTGGDVEFQRELASHGRLLRHLSLFSERAALSAVLDWLKDLEFRKAKAMPEGALVDGITRFINETELLPQGATLARIDPDGVMFRDGNGVEVPADDLSDGYRSILSLALDLLRHLAAELGHDRLFTERDGQLVVDAEGVVIIDEVDAHLHPTWQQRVGPWFKQRFPRMQFLVATHSAIVCQSADSVFLLPTPGEHDEPRALSETELRRLRYGDLIDAFSTGVFGDDVTRSDESRRCLDELAKLNALELERPLTEGEFARRAELREAMPSTAFDVPGGERE